MQEIFQNYVNLLALWGVPSRVIQVGLALVAFAAVAGFMVVTVMFMVYLERKILAVLTIRKGPNRVGPFGSLQIIADTVKLLQKEDIIPLAANPVLFSIAPLIAFIPVMVVYGLVPYAAQLIAINVASGLLLVLAISSITAIGIMLGGWASNNKYALIGGMRATAQAISYEIPMVLSALSIVVLSGSMRMTDIVAAQSGGISSLPVLNWNIFSWNLFPGFIGFVVFTICVLAEINRTPFDLPEAESELVSGYNTEYSGLKFAYFFLAEYASFFIMSLIVVTLFLGGSLTPFAGYLLSGICKSLHAPMLVREFAQTLEQAAWLFGKTYAVVLCIIWIRATMPRLRVDHLMEFTWKILMPLSLVNLLIVSIIRISTHH